MDFECSLNELKASFEINNWKVSHYSIDILNKKLEILKFSILISKFYTKYAKINKVDKSKKFTLERKSSPGVW